MFFNEAYNKLNNLFGRGWPNQMIKIISKNSNRLSSLEQAMASEQSRSFEDGWQNNCCAKLVSLQEAILQDTDSLQKQFVQNHPLCYRPAHLDDKDALQKKLCTKPSSLLQASQTGRSRFFAKTLLTTNPLLCKRPAKYGFSAKT